MPPKNPPADGDADLKALNNIRRESVAAARAQLQNVVAQLELAHKNVASLGVSNPLVGELREAVIGARRMEARAGELLRRIP